MHSYLLVKEGDRVTYYGCENYPAEVVKRLERYENFNSGSSDSVYMGGRVQALVKQISFQIQSRTEAHLLFLIFLKRFLS